MEANINFASGENTSLEGISLSQKTIGKLRPYVHGGKAYISVFKGGDEKDPKNYSTMQVNTGTLTREEWMALDAVVVKENLSRLTGVNEFINRGLVYNLNNAMATTVLETQKMEGAFEADLTMDAVTRAKGNRPTFSSEYLPIPIIHVDYEINDRVLQASRNGGNPLDTTSAMLAARAVAEKMENMLFTNTTYTFGGGTIYSLTNYTDRETLTLSNYSGGWLASGVTPTDIINDIIAMKQKQLDNKFYGTNIVFIPSEYETVLDKDYSVSGQSTQTIRERIMKIGGIADIKVNDTLANDNILMVQLSPDVVRIVRGLGLTNVQWGTEGNFVHKYKALAIQVPQIRTNPNGKCGIIHMA